VPSEDNLLRLDQEPVRFGSIRLSLQCFRLSSCRKSQSAQVS